MDPIEKTSKKIKKLKKNGTAANNIVKNYAKLASRNIIDILKDLFQARTSQAPESLSASMNVGALLSTSQLVYLLIDELTARELEDIVATTALSKTETKLVRATNVRPRNSQPSPFGIWHEIFNREQKKLDKGPIREVIKIRETSQKDSTSFFDRVQPFILRANQLKENLYPNPESHPEYKNTIGWTPDQPKAVVYAMDCEMVETVSGFELARLTLVDENFATVYDQLVRPQGQIINYHSDITGIDVTTFEVNKAISIDEVISDLQVYIDNRTILVGHSLENDLHALKLIHNNVADTSVIFPKGQGYKYSLKSLAYNYFKVKIQESTHDSSEDAKMALALLRLKAEILKHFPEEPAQGKDYDALKAHCENENLLMLDFRFNIQNLFQYGVSYEKVEDTLDIFKLVEKHIVKEKSESGFCSLIYSRLYMHKVNYEAKQTQLVQFLNWVAAQKAEGKSFTLIMTTLTCTRFHKVDGFDVVYFI